MRLIFALLTLLIAGCGATGGHCARLPAAGQYCLRPGPWPDFAAEQAATVNYRNQAWQLLARIESGRDGLRFAGLSPLGQTLIQISWENGALRAELPPALDGRLDGALFPALLQMAVWPAERVREGLSDRLELIEEEGRRIIRQDRQELLIISWEGKTLPHQRLRIEAPGVGLSIDARTLAPAEAP